jgi:hypothetical protein
MGTGEPPPSPDAFSEGAEVACPGEVRSASSIRRRHWHRWRRQGPRSRRMLEPESRRARAGSVAHALKTKRRRGRHSPESEDSLPRPFPGLPCEAFKFRRGRKPRRARAFDRTPQFRGRGDRGMRVSEKCEARAGARLRRGTSRWGGIHFSPQARGGASPGHDQRAPPCVGRVTGRGAGRAAIPARALWSATPRP